jgi:hypothetical protein
MTPSRAASITAVVVWSLVALVLWSATADSAVGTGDRIQQLVAAASVLGTPLAIAGAVIVHRFVTAAQGRDLSERLLAVGTAGLREPRIEWGVAMRAELASIDDPRERRRFAIGCTMTALRTGAGRGPWLIAVGTGLLFAICTFAASRATLPGGTVGTIGFTLASPPLMLFAVTFLTALTTRSFRTGLASGVLALLAGLVCMLAVAMAEAAHLHDVAGNYLVYGDFPREGLHRFDAAPAFVVGYLLIWLPWPVLGAAAGSWRRGRTPGKAPLAAMRRT